MSELLNCPFCGSKAHTSLIQSMWFVECDNKDCGALMGFDAEKVSQEEAISAWNRRTQPAACEIAEYAEDCKDCGFCAQPANEPLTLEQMVEKRGEPLWYRPIGEGTPFDYDPAWFICNLDNLPEPFYSYGKTWLAYDHKPERSENDA